MGTLVCYYSNGILVLTLVKLNTKCATKIDLNYKSGYFSRMNGIK